MATWLSILKKGHTAYGINKNLGMYRIVEGSISNNKIKAAKSVWRTYRDIEKMSIVKSSYYFLSYAFNATIRRI